MSRPCVDADWPAPPGVRAFTTLRHGAGRSQAPFDSFNLGNRTAADGDDAATVEANRRELAERFDLPSAPRWLRQVHGTRVLRFDDAPQRPLHSGISPGHPGASGSRPERLDPHARRPGYEAEPASARHAPYESVLPASMEPEADAAVTATPGLVLAILTADCLPVLLCSRDGREVGGAHAGWRGLADGVVEATVAAMRTAPADLLAWLGPAAGPAHYEVGVEVYDAFVSRDWACGGAFTGTRPGHWRVDLYALARRRLQAAGVPATQIHGGGLCTIAEPQRFYSHRRDRRTGRMASVIWTTRGQGS